MPIYQYKCPHKSCSNKKAIAIEHEMKFIGKEYDLPIQILHLICCDQHGLKSRIPQEPILMGFSGGTSKTEHELVLDKQKQRKLRSRHQFVNEAMHKLKPGEQRHFKKKFKNLEKKDHEKMK